MRHSAPGEPLIAARILLALAAAAFLVVGLAPTADVARAASPADEPVAQEPQLGLPESPRNLQVLPADMSTRAVIGVMRGFSGALGVRCIHCHVGDDASDLSSTDFASDAKEAKQIARVMMRMVGSLNDELLAPGLREIGRTEPMDVRCSTCHHGNNRPVELRAVLAESFASGGIDALLARYDELRAEYYGGWTYDFSENALLGLAEQVLADGALEDALALVDKNLELFPESAFSYITRSQLLGRSGDFDAGMATLDECAARLAGLPQADLCDQGKQRLQQMRERQQQ